MRERENEVDEDEDEDNGARSPTGTKTETGAEKRSAVLPLRRAMRCWSLTIRYCLAGSMVKRRAKFLGSERVWVLVLGERSC